MPTNQQRIIQHALQGHTSLALRSENYGRTVSFLDLAADQYGLSELDTSDWQVIYGRRGTGKTHLLKSFQEFVRQRSLEPASSQTELIFYFSAHDFRVSEEDLPEASKARSYFQVFLDQLSTKILDYVDEITSNASLLNRLIGDSTAKRERVEELALRIGLAAQYGDAVGSLSNGNTTREKTASSARTKKSGASGGVGLGLAASGGSGALSISAKGEAAAEHHEADKAVTTFSEHTHPRFDKVKSLLLSLIDLISVERVFILIDEWPLLDPTGLTRVQPEFANLLKKIFSGSGRVSVKLATNRFQTRLSYRDDARGMVGLETDADIFEAVNLDHALLQERELQSFYETMLFKRLCVCSPEFSILMLRPAFWKGNSGGLKAITPNDVPEGFIETIFRDKTAFVELTKGCEGIPRDFLELFNRLVKKSLYSSDKWTLRQVREAIRESKISSYLSDLEYNSPSYRLLNISLRSIVLKTGRREFSIHIDDYNTFSVILEVLLEKRIIHEYPVARIPDEHRDKFKVYLIDYGYCLDWVGYYQSDLDSIFGSDTLTYRDIESIRLTERVIESDAIIVGRRQCPHCEKFFSPEAKAYVKKKLCPVCFEQAE
jgi:hypothetical protein